MVQGKADKNERVIKIIILSVISLVAIYFIVSSQFLKYNRKYTIGVVTKIEEVAEGGPVAYYKFKYKNKEYELSYGFNRSQDVKVGNHYVIMFNSEYPRFGKAFWELRYLLSLENIPLEGWDSVPPIRPNLIKRNK